MKKRPAYNHKKTEKKWQGIWLKKKLYKASDTGSGKKAYVLDMFPYPSGEGLHAGHVRVYTASDVYSRMKRMQGYNVLHPTGWDAFGLPAEEFALKNKIHPSVSVKKNIDNFRRQMRMIGLSYDWEREVNTTDPSFYKWTQWIFLKLLEKGLAYESYEPINWCPSCKTGLANEDLEGNACERCGTTVEKKPMRQWVLRITNYADRLIKDLDGLSGWPDAYKDGQRNWIGRSDGAEVDFPIYNSELTISVFTTRPDTLFGATYMVLAPEHKFIEKLKPQIKNWDEIEKYKRETEKRTEIERTAEGKEKTGVKLDGILAVNPVNGEKLPVFIADYVLVHYGTGAIMAVPAHDERDYAFAKKFNLPIKEVVLGGDISKEAYAGAGKTVNSGKFSGLENEKAKKEITEFAGGKSKTTYKLRDWVFSRQRYWGEPIPVIHCPKHGVVPVPENKLPVILPKVKSYEPTGTGESPLAGIKSWVNTKCPKCGGPGKRETNTMPQWAGSSWYYLRFIDPKNKKALADKKKEKKWSPVDVYVGGAEHTTRHLIYARFWHKFLKDIGAVSGKEPFSRLEIVGLILAEGGKKMSKRFGNVVNPDAISAAYGSDTLRLYEMFIGPFSQASAWDTKSIIGPRRFLERVWKLPERIGKPKKNPGMEYAMNEALKKVTEDIESFKFNTSVSTLMTLLNTLEKEQTISKKDFETFIIMLAPFAPHIAEELWTETGSKKSIHLSSWPKIKIIKKTGLSRTISVQINGKMRGTVTISGGEGEKEALARAKSNPETAKWLLGKEVLKTFYVKDRLINIVISG